MSCDEEQTPAQMMQKAREMQAAIYKRRLDELIAVYGSMRAVGRALNIDHAYLHRLAGNEKQHPSKVVLRKLGFL